MDNFTLDNMSEEELKRLVKKLHKQLIQLEADLTLEEEMNNDLNNELDYMYQEWEDRDYNEA